MNWYKQAQEVQIASECSEGVVVYIGDKRYWCPGNNPKNIKHLNALINAGAFGKAKQLIRNWPCHREELKNQQDPQRSLW